MNPLAIERWRPRLAQREEAGVAAERRAWTASQLQSEYLDLVFGYAARRLDRTQDAEDVTADVFAAAFEKLHQLRDTTAPQAWLLGIARRKVIDSLRKQRRRREALESDLPPTALGHVVCGADDDPERAFERAEAARKLRELVDRLKVDQREALLLHYVEGLPVTSVAAVMGRSVGAVNSLLQRARASVCRSGRGYFLTNEEAVR